MYTPEIVTPIPGLGLQRPYNLGKVFYVDVYGPDADESNEGTDPNHPLKQIATAFGKCEAGRNDYIIVIDAWTDDTEPIIINKARTHLIGVNAGTIPPFVTLQPTGDFAVFQIPTAGQACEIAGFNIGGGESRGGIQSQESPFGLWIHHNVFGHEFPGGVTPAYGIESNHSPSGMVHTVIEDNIFYGTDGIDSYGKIDTNGMLMYGCKGLVLRRNTFMGIPGINVRIDNGVKMIIEDNRFALDGNTAGRAITLIGCEGCWIDGNKAGFSKTNMAAVAYADDNSDNHWGVNTSGGEAATYPS